MYFTEFEFCFADVPETLYWFPVLINAKDIEHAEAVQNKIIRLLTKKFNLLKTYELRVYQTPLYSKTLKPLVTTQQKAEILKLNLKALTITNFEKEIGIKLSNQYQIIPQMLLNSYRHTVMNKLKNLSFLTTQFHHELDFEKECLVMRLKANDAQ